MKISLYMVTHKEVDYIPKGRTPIYVGGGNNEKKYIRDNTGDNIAEKNSNYCELTALYWIWKNDKDSDYVGIEHYRRFFLDKFSLKPISKNKIENILKDYDAIVAKKSVYKKSVYDYYAEKHYISDFEEIKKIIKKQCPEYLNAYDRVMNGNISNLFNMTVISKKDFDNYCKWLFDILFELEEIIDISERDSYQKRVYGFLSERLFNIWLEQNAINIKEQPIYYLMDNKLYTYGKTIKHLLKIKEGKR